MYFVQNIFRCDVRSTGANVYIDAGDKYIQSITDTNTLQYKEGKYIIPGMSGMLYIQSKEGKYIKKYITSPTKRINVYISEYIMILPSL